MHDTASVVQRLPFFGITAHKNTIHCDQPLQNAAASAMILSGEPDPDAIDAANIGYKIFSRQHVRTYAIINCGCIR